ncbi:MAG TPA: hypothetical protein VGU74_01530 [Gemmatimonadales bacterium]|nr:hypothetical protein [Gemmatimonadales bacterium]
MTAMETGEMGAQRDAMDVLQAWVDRFNARAGGSIALESGGEAGGAQLRLKYRPAEGMISILHLVAVQRGGRAAIVVKHFDGPVAETGVQAGLWASAQLGRGSGGAGARGGR